MIRFTKKIIKKNKIQPRTFYELREKKHTFQSTGAEFGPQNSAQNNAKLSHL